MNDCKNLNYRTPPPEVTTSFSRLSRLFQFGGLGVRSHYFCIAVGAPELMRIRSYQCSSFRKGNAKTCPEVRRACQGLTRWRWRMGRTAPRHITPLYTYPQNVFTPPIPFQKAKQRSSPHTGTTTSSQRVSTWRFRGAKSLFL